MTAVAVLTTHIACTTANIDKVKDSTSILLKVTLSH